VASGVIALERTSIVTSRLSTFWKPRGKGDKEEIPTEYRDVAGSGQQGEIFKSDHYRSLAVSSRMKA
jgi:hypothetical protein